LEVAMAKNLYTFTYSVTIRAKNERLATTLMQEVINNATGDDLLDAECWDVEEDEDYLEEDSDFEL
jgi:Na+-translocating ferredoxin:NAD+ oxidoreductase RnfG subunit